VLGAGGGDAPKKHAAMQQHGLRELRKMRASKGINTSGLVRGEGGAGGGAAAAR
jgi:hypothetical protein